MIATLLVILAICLLADAAREWIAVLREAAAERRSQKHMDELIAQIDAELPYALRLGRRT